MLLWYHQEEITFPRRHRLSGTTTIHWRLPDYQQLLRIIKNPTYAGAFAHGKSQSQTSIVDGRSRKTYGRRVPLQEWSVLIKEHHQGYISWERYVKNLEQLKSNSTKMHGAPRRGSALLSGLLRCGNCGLKLSVAYRDSHGKIGRYQCMREEGKPQCQTFAAFRVDQAVEVELLKACEPVAVEASLRALDETGSAIEQKRKLLETAFEKACYEVDRARRQYDAVDPANRLVAAELEARWNHALTDAAEAESKLEEATREQEPLSSKQKQKILSLGTNIQKAWNDPAAPLELKKRILRTAIREIVVKVNNESAKVELVIHWSGGVHTELQVAKNRTGRNKNAVDHDTVEMVRELARGWSDKYIAQMLNRIGSRTGPGNSWSETRVKSFRGHHNIPVFSSTGSRPWLTMEEVAEQLGVNIGVIRTMVKHEILPARQVARGLPWMIKPCNLELPKVIHRVQDAKQGKKTPREDARQIIIPSL